jgi:Cell wall-active antibiotics response 4TMS YvqF
MTNSFEQSMNPDNYISTTAIFGEVKKSILSKDFKGGNITNVFGATDIDFSNADINGVAVLDISQIFGEVKIFAPANWHIVTEVSNILAEAADKRKFTGEPVDKDKVLVIKGFSVFAAVKIISCVNVR